MQRRKVSELLLLPVVVEGDLLEVAVVRLRRGAVAGVHRGLGLVRVRVWVRLRVSVRVKVRVRVRVRVRARVRARARGPG